MTQQQHGSSTATEEHHPKVVGKKLAETAVQFTQQAEKLSHQHPTGEDPGVAIEAQFVTPHDPVIITSDGKRLPGVPLQEAHKLNVLREELQGKPESVEIKAGDETKEKISNIEKANPEQKKSCSVAFGTEWRISTKVQQQQHIAKTDTPFSYQSSLPSTAALWTSKYAAQSSMHVLSNQRILSQPGISRSYRLGLIVYDDAHDLEEYLVPVDFSRS